MSSQLKDLPLPSIDDELSDRKSENDSFDQELQLSIPLSSPGSPAQLSSQEHDPFSQIQPSLSPLQLSSKSEITQNVTLNSKSLGVTSDEEAGGSFASSRVPSGNIRRSSQTSTSATTTSVSDDSSRIMKYPPPHFGGDNETSSMMSFSSTSSRKARPESSLIDPPVGPIVPGIALVDFNHLVGPKIEFTEGSIFDDEQLAAILPFLALPDGAHMSSEDYTYFHLVHSGPNSTTLFGISCNRQIKSSELIVRDEDVTRSTVQKAVVVLATKPLFGPIRDKLGVVTRAFFDQRDFREKTILVDFKSSLELALRSQLTESALYMGTKLRELVHKFRGRTLLLLKTLMLQKRIMFYGHPVETLCTYQYSLISLIPGLLQNLDDCGSPPLTSRARTLQRANSLKTSDRKSLLAYLGLPLDIFGMDAFFQPYLPLQQVDLLRDTRSWLCGTTNSIVTQQKEIDLLINIETNTFEFRDPKLERLVSLTAADRKWMDEVVKDVNESWSESDSIRTGLQFKGSEDYLRSKFEEYVTAALSSVKYADFLAKGEKQDILITGGTDGGDANAIADFNMAWISEFRRTNAFDVWNRITDPMLFDIIEARHPCAGKTNVVADISLRLQEGFQDLHLEESLAPTREAISRTFASGSTSFFKAVEGVRERWVQRSATMPPPSSSSSSTLSSPPIEISRSEAELATPVTRSRPSSTISQSGLKPLSLSSSSTPPPPAPDVKTTFTSWGSSVGSFLSTTVSRFNMPRTDSNSTASSSIHSPPPLPASSSVATYTSSPPRSSSPALSFSSWTFNRQSMSKTPPRYTEPEPIEVDPSFQPRDLGEGFGPNGRPSAMPESRSSTDSFVKTGVAL